MSRRRRIAICQPSTRDGIDVFVDYDEQASKSAHWRFLYTCSVESDRSISLCGFIQEEQRSNEATKECFVAYATRDHQQPRTLGIAHGGGGGGGGGGIAFCGDR